MLGNQQCLYQVNVFVINYTTNRFVPVVKKRILDIMLSVRRINQSSLLYIQLKRCFTCLFFDPTSSLSNYILVKSLVYFSILHLRFLSLFQTYNIVKYCILKKTSKKPFREILEFENTYVWELIIDCGVTTSRSFMFIITSIQLNCDI